MKEATQQKIEGNPVKAVEMVSQKFGFSSTESGGVLQHLIQGGDLSAYGLLNAITRTSQDVQDYDRATELERDGSRVLDFLRESNRKSNFKVNNCRNQVEAQTKTLPAVAIAFAENPKYLQFSINVFRHNPQSCQLTIVLTLG